MRHLTFHVAKYAGRLARADQAVGEANRTIVDAFIVGLSAGDVLRINLADELTRRPPPGVEGDLLALGHLLNTEGVTRGSIVEWYFRELADTAGRMAKA